jgi:hypothetical protein
MKGSIVGRKIIVITATLAKWVRDPRSGELHHRSEEVTIISVKRNLDRTLLKVRWQSGGECVVFPEEIENIVDGIRQHCEVADIFQCM